MRSAICASALITSPVTPCAIEPQREERRCSVRSAVVRILAGMSIGMGLLLPNTASADTSVSCEEVTFAVALTPGSHAIYHIEGTLCGSLPSDNRTLQILVPGSTYSRVYWDFPYQPEQYSYAQAASAAGYLTLSIDRIGIGSSDRPPADQVNLETNAFTLHQIVQAFRAGAVASQIVSAPVERIMLVGHSFGSVVSTYEAATYGDVDGVIISGYLHNVSLTSLAYLGTLYPVQLDPKFSSSQLPLGYLTSLPNTRATYFYFLPGADPVVINLDESLKETVTNGERSLLDPTLIEIFAASLDIDVPVLSASGDYDHLFCAPPSCTASNSMAYEATWYAPEACFESYVLPDSGHDMNLHLGAPQWFNAAIAWANARVGLVSNHPPPVPCP